MQSGRLRIAIFSDSALPILNGVSVSVDLLVRQLRDAGHSVHLYTAQARGYRDADPNTFRFRAIETPWVRGYALAYPPFYGLLRRFRQHEYDVIHSHTPFTIGFVGLRWAQSHGIPIVSTYHTLYDRYAHYVPIFPKRYVRFKMAKHTNFYYNAVDRVIVPSSAAQRWLRRHAVETPIEVIPTGAPQAASLDRSEIRRKLGIPPEQRILLYVGRIAKEKNLAVLFEMAKQVFERDENARLWLVGDGPYRAQCTEVVRRLGIGDRLRFVGFVPRAEVDQFYAAADLFVFSSITETQGLVIQEAMAYGLPAVVVAGGGAGEALEDGVNGLLVRNDVPAFAEQVATVLNDESLYARLSAAASKSVRGRTAGSMARDVVEVYRQAMGTRPASEGEPGLARV
jgi:glycosyltransferase involved in cell wall biosynthesis